MDFELLNAVSHFHKITLSSDKYSVSSGQYTTNDKKQGKGTTYKNQKRSDRWISIWAGGSYDGKRGGPRTSMTNVARMFINPPSTTTVQCS